MWPNTSQNQVYWMMYDKNNDIASPLVPDRFSVGRKLQMIKYDYFFFRHTFMALVEVIISQSITFMINKSGREKTHPFIMFTRLDEKRSR